MGAATCAPAMQGQEAVPLKRCCCTRTFQRATGAGVLVVPALAAASGGRKRPGVEASAGAAPLPLRLAVGGGKSAGEEGSASAPATPAGRCSAKLNSAAGEAGPGLACAAGELGRGAAAAAGALGAAAKGTGGGVGGALAEARDSAVERVHGGSGCEQCMI